MLPNVGENTKLRFRKREDFPWAWLLRVTFSIKACKPILVHCDFHSGPT